MLDAAVALLRGERVRDPRSILAVGLAAAFAYGATMGLWGARPLQALYSAVKVPGLLAVATALCLPSFFVLNTVLGLRDDFAAALRGVLSAQGAVALGLAALAPLTGFGYACGTSYRQALLLNGLMFALATGAGQVVLARHYAPLLVKRPRHRTALRAWLALYWLVAIQMAWVLRPFLGDPGLPTTFFRAGAWGNAYIEVLEALWRVLR